ncbi:FkbM family methyltransferase [Halopiger djelfimassiliensis]|uniref:FkbM family methyltransferase n=1 Tax=Halopiger djelfimassiliensis TaxID=1293047 RepID=UPI0012B5CF19|nr:FkbM family methyltransferase [Halopiger djelfimassiliensis]
MKQPTFLERFKVYTMLRRIYDYYLRPRLPRKIGVYNGVPVRDRALFDITDEQPNYEGALIAALRDVVATTDRCLIVGGGRGVSGTVAANLTGPSGHVTVYEGSHDQVKLVRETLELAQVSEWTTVHHAIVSKKVEIYGESGDADRISADELPNCDTLILDCEGAEISIINSLDEKPENIIVETHAVFGSPESDVRAALNNAGYSVVDKKTEYEDRGIHVLTAVTDEELESA